MIINKKNKLRPVGVKEREKRRLQKIREKLREEAFIQRKKNKEKFTYKKIYSSIVSPKK